jgi:FKBP-type peptidyl-prolyl cis-trans isomerase (trigger factor)
MNKKIIIIISILIFLGILSGVLFYFRNEKDANLNKKDLVEETSSIVARVNNTDISQSELEDSENQIAMNQRIDLSTLDDETRKQIKDQALDNLISNILIKEAIAKSDIKVTTEDIEFQLDQIKSQFSEDGQYEEVLASQGISEEDLKVRIKTDIFSQKYFEENLDLESITVSEEEINDLYEQESNINDEIPPLSEVYDQIESFIIGQKQEKLVSDHIQELKVVADIQILL